jgi:DNA gyrase/topoisomerase IV subunit A
MPIDDIRQMGRATQGVIVMRLRERECVSALAPVVESSNGDGETEIVAPVAAEETPSE